MEIWHQLNTRTNAHDIYFNLFLVMTAIPRENKQEEEEGKVCAILFLKKYFSEKLKKNLFCQKICD